MSDAAYIQGLINAGSSIPSGIYQIETGLTIGNNDAVVDLSGVELQQLEGFAVLITVTADNVEIVNGTLTGTWDMADQGTDSITPGSRRGVVMNAASITRFTMTGTRIQRFDNVGFLIYPRNNGTEVRLTDVVFFENFSHASIIIYLSSMVSIKTTLRGVVFDTTATPGTPGSVIGGNAFSNIGVVNNIKAERCTFRNTGRMNWENFRGDDYVTNRGPYGTEQIYNCRFFRPFYRSLSTGAVNLVIQGCYIEEATYLEFGAVQGLSFKGNHCVGGGIYIPNGSGVFGISDNIFDSSSDQYRQGALFFRWKFSTGENGTFQANAYTDLIIEGNTCNYTHDSIDDETVYKIIRIDKTASALLYGGTISYAGNAINNTTSDRGSFETDLYSDIEDIGISDQSVIIDNGWGRNPDVALSVNLPVKVSVSNASYDIEIHSSITDKTALCWHESISDAPVGDTIKSFVWEPGDSRILSVTPDNNNFTLKNFKMVKPTL